MASKTLLLASSIALTFSAGISHSSIEVQNKIELLKLESQLTAITSPNKQIVKKPANSRKAYYVRYAKANNVNEKAAFKSTLKQAVQSIGARVDYEFDEDNLIAISLPQNSKASLGDLPHVKFFEPVPEHKLMAQVTPWNIDQFQARDVWDKNRDGLVDPGAPTGNGVKFCIIDTGFYAAHDDFQGITHDGISQIPGEAYTEDGNGHGTHVAGTANAVNNNIGVVGVMPGGAELFIVKIFANDGLWSPGNSNLLSAIESCRDNGANAISMSLGGGLSTAERDKFQELYDDNNIVHIAAAGNDGDATRSYPASYDSVISVAALRESDNVADFSQYPATSYDPLSPPTDVEWDVVELSGGGEQVLSTWPGPPAAPNGNVPVYQVTNDGIDYSAIHIEETGSGDVTQNLIDGADCDTAATGGSDNPASWNGNVVLCERNTISFADKMNNVADNGGLAMILYNNEAGAISATCAGACTSGTGIPGVSVTQTQGQFLVANGLGLPTRVIADDGSGCVGCSGGYNTISGTSMATPGVAAGVAWAWSACGGPTGITNKELRQLLRDSARDMSGTHDASGTAYGAGWDPQTGFGLVQLNDALTLGNSRFGSTCPIGLSPTPDSISVCTLSGSPTADYTVTLDASFTGTSNMTFSGIPAGSSGNFSDNPVLPGDNDSIFTVSNLVGIPFAINTITLTATDASNASNNASSDVTLNTYSSTPVNFNLTAPVNNATSVALMPTLTWGSATQADSYTLEIADDMLFSNIVVTEANLTGTSHTLTTALPSDIIHYWRVTAVNPCGNQVSSTFSFTTLVNNDVCTIYNSTDIPINIPANPGPGDILSTLTITDSGTISDVNAVNLTGTHSYISDVFFKLESPSATEIILMPRTCTIEDDWDVEFDDEAAGSTLPCPITDGGSYQPNELLSSFDGEDLNGIWTFTVNDDFNADGGSIDSWGLEICYLSATANNAPTANAQSVSTLEDTAVGVTLTGSDPDAGDSLTYAVASGPTNGTLSGTAPNLTYTPALNYVGLDSFTFTANDGNLDSTAATISITVTADNDAPIADDDSYTTPEDTTLTVAAVDGVLNGDTDADGNSLTAVIDQQATNGNVNLSSDGSFTYVPNDNYCNDGIAADTFTYHAFDGVIDSNIATVSIAVTCVVDTYTVSVDVSNLLGSGFELQLNTNETLSVTSDGISTFSTTLAENINYTVSVLNHPTDQYCTINNSTGTSIVDITLAVSCGPSRIFSDGFED
jgi:subtilisin family serine protease/subtilisin-like proprotein convertase family protein